MLRPNEKVKRVCRGSGGRRSKIENEQNKSSKNDDTKTNDMTGEETSKRASRNGERNLCVNRRSGYYVQKFLHKFLSENTTRSNILVRGRAINGGSVKLNFSIQGHGHDSETITRAMKTRHQIKIQMLIFLTDPS